MADVFDVTVSELLGCDTEDVSANDYPRILTLLNEELAAKKKKS